MALGALALVAVAAAGILFVRGAAPAGPDEALDPFVAAWTREDDRGAAALTTDPRAAAAALAVNRRGLDGARVNASVTSVDEQGDSARATVLMRWDVPALGARLHVMHVHERGMGATRDTAAALIAREDRAA